MAEHRIGIIMNGVTGRMGRNQHLVRSILAIREQGGVRVGDDTIFPEPLLVGRNADRVRRVAEETGCREWTTDLGSALERTDYAVYFDAVSTQARPEAVRRAVAAGKHVYCEKPTAPTLEEALELYRLARDRGVKHGVVQDKLWLPGIRKLQNLLRSGFFGRILAVRGEFGYWVFDGEIVPCQRPSWNYRKEEGGGIVVDMFPHWRYLLDNLFGGVEAVTCTTDRLIPERIDERGRRYPCTADDA
ncbi:MAG TPA: Gfo/Idh/MocA family oxidoreductase, partial [Acidobacteriota bacterium]|nr:Gfo/Idh/MocA family oxidoreductase [Acidobacteriota bacterium]